MDLVQRGARPAMDVELSEGIEATIRHESSGSVGEA